jgi:RNA-directed DNA polymerase
MDADIKGFFDNISHEWIIQNIPMNKRILKEWLKAGALDMKKSESLDTDAGVPQGGPISPTIANMTLDGLEYAVKSVTQHLAGRTTVKGKRRGFSPKVHVVRYRDDFIVTARTRGILLGPVKDAIIEFLGNRGLQLNQDKTTWTRTTKGFDFLGFHFRRYPSAHKKNGYTTLVKPTKKGVKRLIGKIKGVVKIGSSATDLIRSLNPILRGWANYYAGVVAARIFRSLDHYIWFK